MTGSPYKWTNRPLTTIVIPPGTPVHSMKDGEWRESTRTQTVNAEVITYEGDPERDRPTWEVTTWPGAGGYWRRTYRRDGQYVAEFPSR